MFQKSNSLCFVNLIQKEFFLLILHAFKYQKVGCLYIWLIGHNKKFLYRSKTSKYCYKTIIFTMLIFSVTFSTTSLRFPQSSIKLILRRKIHRGFFICKNKCPASNYFQIIKKICQMSVHFHNVNNVEGL